MKFIKSFWLLWIVVIVTNQNLSSQELLFLPWGSNDNEIALRKAPNGQFGPMSFAVKGNQILILDTQNKKLKIFQNSKLIKSFSLPSSYIDDFAWISEDDFYLLENNRVYPYNNQKLKSFSKPDSPRNLITELRTVNNNVQIILNESFSAQGESDKKSAYSETSGIEDPNGRQILIKKHNWNNITVNTGSGKSFEITSTNNDLGLARYLGSTPSGDMYIYLEKIMKHVPLSVKRQVYLYSPSGEIKKVINIPLNMHSYVFSEFYVDETGNLFHMLSAEEGIYVLGWYLDSKKVSNNKVFEYPPKFLKTHHYNNIVSETPDFENIPQTTKSTAAFDTVSRAEALATGDTYVQHVWYAEAKNLTNGRILDPNGIEIETPAWVQIGENAKVPYRWGGFNTLENFDSGLLSGKYAGDIATTGESPYCVGVDCSGFVSQCWKLPVQYSTRMMDDYITVAYDNWADLQAADAIHIVGHVRMFVEQNPNGSLLVVEASGADWRVSYRSYTLSQLTSYTPRYYIYMEGSPAYIPGTELASVAITDSVHLNWKLVEPNSFYAYNLYTNKTDDIWEFPAGGELISSGVHSASLPIINDTAVFYKITCVSDAIDLEEGNHSDIYGYFHSDTSKKVLIVDGFDRIAGSYKANYHDFARTLGKTLAAYKVAFESADNDAVLRNEIHLDDYDAVFWILGDESTEDETFDTQEQYLVKKYLLQGGKIFISGSEIAWDLDYKGSSSDKAFIQDYLMTKYDQDDAQSYTVIGAAGSAFAGLSISFDNGTHGIYEEDYPDSYLPNGASSAALMYGNGLIAATSYEGTLSGGTAPAKIVMMGFPFETIYNENDRLNFMEKLLGYFEFIPSTVNVAEESIPEKHILFTNYPNPFASNTNIQFQLANSQNVSLEIYKLNGQKVTTLVSQKLTQGSYHYQWNASGFAPGVYFYVLKTSDGFEKTKKMVLMPNNLDRN
ncbi:MAG: T9SS type A sorting domain-containing protein [Bacteroidales bacterium]|nr:T9SS type A sorting domain-containing protein [Bacteroidales bacterium]MCF8389755.1 T9SS type A sorting domain-containing protein [Bacteroidales bacterium]